MPSEPSPSGIDFTTRATMKRKIPEKKPAGSLGI